MKHILIIVTFFITFIFSSAAQPQNPSGLMVNFLRNPSDALITDPVPSFCWIVDGYKNDLSQTAYQIVVGTDSSAVYNGEGNLWNSEKQEGDKSCNIAYDGKPLESYTKYWWALRYWTNTGVKSDYSPPQAFFTGNLSKPDSMAYLSLWDNLPDGVWRLEDRQRAHYTRIKPEKIWEMNTGHYIIDFGKAAFASLQLTLTAPTDGDTVWINLAERGTENNTLHKNPGITSIVYKEMHLVPQKGTHTYTLDLPRVVSHYLNSQVLAGHMPEVLPFRFAEIKNAPSSLTLDKVQQLALFYYFDDHASHFISDNENLNQIWDLCKYTLKATPFLSLYADGNRERMPYEADAYIQQLGHYSVDRDYGIARYTWQFLLFNPSWPSEWQFHTLFMAWQDYMYTGNAEMLKNLYHELRKKTLIALEEDNGLISTRTGKVTPEFKSDIYYRGNRIVDIVDWPPGRPENIVDSSNWRSKLPPAGERDNFVFTDYNTVVNAFYYQALRTMSDVAEVTGNKKDQKFFTKKADHLSAIFDEYFFNKDKGIYVDGVGTDHSSLHANMFPLAFGLVKEEKMPAVIAHIKSRKMACSVYGAQYLLEALFENDEGAYAMELITSETDRSWMNMIKTGATMTTEAWGEKYKPNLTWNHAWGTAPANILVRKVAGVEPAVPGYGVVSIKPRLNLLNFASFKIPIATGFIFINWELKNNVYDLSVSIPANVKANLILPDGKTMTLHSGIHNFKVGVDV